MSWSFTRMFQFFEPDLIGNTSVHSLKMRGLTAKFFTKPGCTLCVPALQAVERAQLKVISFESS